MKQKIVFSILPALFLLLNADAQKSAVILRGGVNLANVTVSADGTIEDAKTLTRFQAGIIGDFNINNFFAVQPGFLVTGKGAKTEAGDPADANYFKATTNPIYLEIPLNFVLKFEINDGPVLFAGAGPYLGIGIAGKNKIEGKFLGTAFNSEDNIEWSDDDPTTFNFEEGAGLGKMRRFDYGLNGTAGIDLKKIVLSANYGLGLAKLQSASDNSDENNKHRVLSFTVGFKL